MEEESWLFTVGGITFDGTIVSMTILTCLIVFALVYMSSRKLSIKPTGMQNVMEFLIDFVRGIVEDNVQKKEVKEYHLLAFTFFMFILVSNLLGLVTKITLFPSDVSLWKSPTADPTVTLTLAFIAIVLANYYGVKKQGAKDYFVNSYTKPVKFMLPMKITEEFTNVLTLGLRLYGNIFAGEVLLSLIANVGSRGPTNFILALPLEVIWQGFSVFIGGIQAFIFATLTMVYISHKVEVDH